MIEFLAGATVASIAFFIASAILPRDYVIISPEEQMTFLHEHKYISYCRREWDAGCVPMSLPVWEQENK